MELQDTILRLLDERGLSQSWLAKQASVTEATISRILKGINMPGADLLEKLADAFGVSCDYLLGRSLDPYINSDKENLEYAIGRAYVRCDPRDRRIVLAVLDDYFTAAESDLVYRDGR